MEEDIKILEEIKEGVLKASECSLTSVSESNHWKREAQAIENIIKRYKELDEYYKEQNEVNAKFIPKSKIEKRLKTTENVYHREFDKYIVDLGEGHKVFNASLLSKKEKEKVLNERNCLLVQMEVYRDLLESEENK